jgi:hypothetical protein
MPGRYQFSLPARRQRDGWFRLGGIDVTTTALLVLLGVASMFWYAVDKQSVAKLAFKGYYVRQGEIWRLLTWPLFNPPSEIWVIITLAFFWFVGHVVEDQIGRSRFTKLVLAMTVLPAMLVTVLGFDPSVGTYGLGVLAMGLLVIFALDNPGAMFFFGIPAWAMAAVFVGIDVLRYLSDRLYEPLMLELLLISVGLVGARQYGMVDQLTFIPRFGAGAANSRTAKPSRPPKSGKRKASGSTVVSGPWADSTPAHSPADEAELNGLLDKINDLGIDALTRDEKSRLNDLSKKLRGR